MFGGKSQRGEVKRRKGQEGRGGRAENREMERKSEAAGTWKGKEKVTNGGDETGKQYGKKGGFGKCFSNSFAYTTYFFS